MGYMTTGSGAVREDTYVPPQKIYDEELKDTIARVDNQEPPVLRDYLTAFKAWNRIVRRIGGGNTDGRLATVIEVASNDPSRALYLINLLNQNILPKEGIRLREFLTSYGKTITDETAYRPIHFGLVDIKEIGLPMVISLIKAILNIK